MSAPPFGNWPPTQPPVTSVFGRVGAVVAAAGDYTSTQITNASAVAGATVTLALNALATGVASLTSSGISNLSSVSGATVTAALNTLLSAIAALSAAISALTSTSIANASAVTGATVTAALTTLNAAITAANATIAALTSTAIANASAVTGATVTAALTTLSAAITAANATIAALTSTSIANASSISGATVTAALNSLLASRGARDPIWDAPTVAGPNDEEFNTDVLAAGTWSIALTASLGTPMTRDGAIDLTQNVASGHYRSSAIGGTLYVQLRQNEEVMIWKTIAAAQSGNLLWFAGVGFQNEIGTASAVDPRCSLQWCNNNAGVPSFADRAFIRTTSSGEAYQMLTVTAGATISNVSTNTFTLMPLQGLALHINHGSAAAGNVGAFGFARNGTLATVCNGNGQQFNAANSKIVFNLQANTAQPPVSGVNNCMFALHFMRSIDLAAGQWIAQA